MTWFLRNWDQVAVALGQHIAIALTALVIAFAMALPVGIAAARSQRVYAAAIAISGLLYTIPTLAFLALLIPLVGLGRTNAIIAMVAFALLVLIRNVATGLREVPADVVDAARGMGMVYGTSASPVVLPIPDAVANTPEGGQFSIRFMNAAYSSIGFDVYVTTPGASLANM